MGSVDSAAFRCEGFRAELKRDGLRCLLCFLFVEVWRGVRLVGR